MNTAAEIYRADQLPVFQNRMFRSAEEAVACVRGDVVLVQDSLTGLIYNRAFDPSLMKYDADYQNEQAVSAAFGKHLDQVALIVQRHFASLDLIEVGCGKGHFLHRLEALGFHVSGFDPTYEGEHPHIARTYFGPDSNVRAEGLILRHVLEHVRDPVSFLTDVLTANGGTGRIYIEVPCLDWIARNRAWFDVFYEHVNYFRLGDLNALFATVYESGHTFGGQYLYAVADLATLRLPRRAPHDRFKLPDDFLGSIDRCVHHYGHGRSEVPAVWGGASKGVIFTLLMQRRGVSISSLIDINPAKQGQYVAATGLRVLSPDEALPNLKPGSELIVMNSNYLAEVKAMTGNQFKYLLLEHEGSR
jgi:Methyltransferase domain